MVPGNTGSRPAGPPPLIDEQLADQLLGKAQAEGVELLGPDGLLSRVTKAVLEITLAYSDSTISSTPVSRRCRLRTICGSNVPARSRGTSICTWPLLSVSTVFGRVPFRMFAVSGSGVPFFSWPRCSVSSRSVVDVAAAVQVNDRRRTRLAHRHHPERADPTGIRKGHPRTRGRDRLDHRDVTHSSPFIRRLLDLGGSSTCYN
jgi:hypothetical protein